MSAAKWRKAMSFRDRGQAPISPGAAASMALRGDRSLSPTSFQFKNPLAARHVAVLLFVLAFPWFATPFFTYQIGAQSLALGLIALSLTFLAGYGGMVSLAQMTTAGIAGYLMAIFGTSAVAEISLKWPWWVAVPFAIALATLAATFIGWLSVRTEGIYTIMITLAAGVAFYYLCLQNYTIFNGFQGFQQVYAPTVAGINFREAVPFYYLALFWSLAGYLGVKYLLRAPFGLALQGIRDNPRRMNALGFNVNAHRIAAYAVAGVIAGVGGILFTWYNNLVTPGSVGTSWMINVLVIAVLGGMRHPVGAFLGAVVFVLLQTFAIDLIDRERFNLVIGVVFLAIVLFSPDGLLGWWAGARSKFTRNGSGS